MNLQIDKSNLALFGGKALSNVNHFPKRLAFGGQEHAAALSCIDYYKNQTEMSYQGVFENQYTSAFNEYMGGGYTDAVSTGTLALYVAIAALQLPKGAPVLMSPITDPGMLSAIILNGLIPKICDTQKNSFNVGIDEVKNRVCSKTSAIVIVHAAGKPVKSIKQIVSLGEMLKVPVVEDCSQAHGAIINKKKLGTYGSISVFSTMYSKSHMSGSSGGLIYSKDLNLHQMALAYADRGKPCWRSDFDGRNPENFLFPALNAQSNEISCAIGLASLGRLDEANRKRRLFCKKISEMVKNSKLYDCEDVEEGDAPFYMPIFINHNYLEEKGEICQAILAEGLPINIDYKYLVTNWQWAKQYLFDEFIPKNASAAKARAFCLYVNENYGDKEVDIAIEILKKIETTYCG